MIQLYSVIGGIILFHYGPFLFFVYPEWYGPRLGTVTSLAHLLCCM